jgi:hypothetical protein
MIEIRAYAADFVAHGLAQPGRVRKFRRLSLAARASFIKTGFLMGVAEKDRAALEKTIIMQRRSVGQTKINRSIFRSRTRDGHLRLTI